MKRMLILFIPWLLLYAPTRTFYSEWGWGYYYWLFGPIGPSWSEGLAAAGYSGLEYRGFTQFALGGWPGNGTQISSLQLRLLNNTGGPGLQIDINRVTSGTPGWSECGGTPPVYLTNQPVNAGADEYTYFDLTGTPARDDFMAAWQGGVPWFGLGLKGSRGSGEPCMHFFYAFWADNYYDAALIVDYVIGVEENSDQDYDARIPIIAIAPNPFRMKTNISIRHRAESIGKSNKQISEPSELQIYDIQGHLIRSFTLSTLPFALCWNGTDRMGQSVPEGVFLVVLKTSSATFYTKVVRLK